MKAYILYINRPESAEQTARASASCLEHDVMCEMVEGIVGKSYDQIKEETGMLVGRSEDDHIYWKEYNAALGHIKIWNKIIESGEAGIVLEHDAVVKYNLNDLEVKDGEILHLGPKVYDIDDYTYPEDFPGEKIYHEVRRWEGAHAYALTPKTAQYLIDKMNEENRLMPTEALVSVRNRYNVQMAAIDPPRVVCVQPKNGISFTDASSEKNFTYFSGFLNGLRPGASLMLKCDYVFSEDWFSGNIPNWKELFALLNKKSHDELKILEIGSYEGRSTMWLIDNMLDHPDSNLVAVDTFEGSIEHIKNEKDWLQKRFMENLMLSKYPEKVIPIAGDSKDVLSMLIQQKAKFDIIYVDGSHETKDVYRDGINSYRLLADNGVIIFDDYLWSNDGGKTAPVMEAVDRFESEFPVQRVMDGWQRAYIKRAS